MIVLDTHVLLWVVLEPERLGVESRRAIADAAGAGAVRVSAISLWEIAMLLRKRRIALDRSLQAWSEAVFVGSHGMRLTPVEGAIALDAGSLDIGHGDPADRILIATARHLRCPLVTADDKILAYAATGGVAAVDAGR